MSDFEENEKFCPSLFCHVTNANDVDNPEF